MSFILGRVGCSSFPFGPIQFYTVGIRNAEKFGRTAMFEIGAVGRGVGKDRKGVLNFDHGSLRGFAIFYILLGPTGPF